MRRCPPSFAGALMCSGLTAYSALKRLQAHAARGPALLVGLGGVGMMGLAHRARAVSAAADRRRHRCRQARGGAQGRRGGRVRSGRPRGAAARSSNRPAAACSRPAISSAPRSRSPSPPARSPRAARWWSPACSAATSRCRSTMFVLKAMTVEGTLTGTLAGGQRIDGAGPRREDLAAADRGTAACCGASNRWMTCAPAGWSDVSVL